MIDSYTINFKDFKTKESFIELQRYFLSLDYKQEFFEQVGDEKRVRVIKLREPIDNPEITNYSMEEGKETYSIIKFEEDFVIPNISGISEKAFLGFQEEVFRTGLHSNELKKGFALDQQNRINEMMDLIIQSTYLGNKIKVFLIKELDQLENLISDYIKNPIPNIKAKIPINWSRTDVIYFFHLLRKNKIIEDIKESDLARIIDNAFEYYDSDSGEFKEIKGSKKLLNDFKNAGGKPENSANERLRGVFLNEDFFAH